MANESDSHTEGQGASGAAYERVLPELLAIPADRVQRVTLDITSAVATALGVVHRLAPHREVIAKHLSAFDHAIDRLQDYAFAMAHADARHSIATRPPDDIDQIYPEALRVRELLHRDATTLIAHGLMPADALRSYRGVIGHQNVAEDLLVLVMVLRSVWPSVEHRCAVQAADLRHAQSLHERILMCAGSHRRKGDRVAEAADRRARAFTLFARAYDDARRFITFLRWREGDADVIVPSLFRGRGGRRKQQPAQQKAAEDSGTVVH